MQTDPDPLEGRAFAALDRLAGGLDRLGIALSGGGDSVALMHLAAGWAADRGIRLAAATVDHGLRDGSAAEAAAAGHAAAALGLDHAVLRWDGAGSGNLMDRARRARLRLLAGWAKDHGLAAVALGHTRDDQAETLLMRLSRGAGIDGLAAMAARREAEGMVWLRPLLDFGRQELRDWLRQIGAGWVDDPSNDDPRFDRARIRRAMAELQLDPAALALAATHLGQARAALNAGLAPVLGNARAHLGALHLDGGLFAALPAEQRRRLILGAVGFVTGAAYPPRRAGTDHALREVAAGRRVTLDGAILDPGHHLLIHREPDAATRATRDGEIWDNRWQIKGLCDSDRVRALAGDVTGFDWRSAGLTHLEAQALPAVIRDGRVLCPAIQPQDGVVAVPIRGKIDFVEYRLGIEPRP